MTNSLQDHALLELAMEVERLRRIAREPSSPDFLESLWYEDDSKMAMTVVREAMLKRERFEHQIILNMKLEDEESIYKLEDRTRWSLTRYILTDTRKEISYEYPEDWWQAVKERWAPEWFKKRYPVKYAGVKINAQVLYPMLDVQLPREEQWVHWTTV